MHFFIQQLNGVVPRRTIALACTAVCAMLALTRPTYGQPELEVDFSYPPSNNISEYYESRFANDVDLRLRREAIQRLAAEGNIEEARQFAKVHCENAKKWVAGGDVHRNALVMAAQLEFLAGNFAEAEVLLRQRLKLGTDYDRAADFINLRLAVVLHAQGHVADGHHLARQWVATIKALPAFESVIDKYSLTPRLASQLRQHADNLVLDGYFSEAALVQEAALEVYDDIAPQELVLADELAGTRVRQRSFRLALPAIKRSEAMVRRVGMKSQQSHDFDYYGQEIQLTREVLFSEAHRAMGDLEPWYRRRLHSGTLLVDPMQNPRYRVAKSIGVAALAAGHLPTAADALYRYKRQATRANLDLVKEFSKEFLVEDAIVFNNAALCASLCGDNEMAQSMLSKSEWAMTDNPHVSPIDRAILESNSAWLCTTNCDYESSIRAARTAVEIATEHLGDRHPDTLILKTQLAHILETSGKYAAASEHYQACKQAFDELLGPRTTYSAYLLNRLGYLAYLDADYPLAESRLIAALAIYDAAEYEHADGQLDSLRNLASLYRRTVEMDKLRAIEERLPFKSRKSTIRSISQR